MNKTLRPTTGATTAVICTLHRLQPPILLTPLGRSQVNEIAMFESATFGEDQQNTRAGSAIARLRWD